MSLRRHPESDENLGSARFQRAWFAVMACLTKLSAPAARVPRIFGGASVVTRGAISHRIWDLKSEIRRGRDSFEPGAAASCLL